MAVQNTEVYHRLCNVAKALEQAIVDPEAETRDKAMCARELVNVEAFKREMRGIPRLAPHSLNDLPIRRARARLANAAPLEVSPVTETKSQGIS